MSETATQRPLGLRVDATLGPDKLKVLSLIENWDLEPIRRRLLAKGTTSEYRVDEVIFEFRRYLGLRAVFPEPITLLSDDVDEIWHACLIFTRMYADLCQSVFGTFLHHDPSTAPDPDPAATWREFEDAYQTLYGQPGPVWEMWRPLG